MERIFQSNLLRSVLMSMFRDEQFYDAIAAIRGPDFSARFYSVNPRKMLFDDVQLKTATTGLVRRVLAGKNFLAIRGCVAMRDTPAAASIRSTFFQIKNEAYSVGERHFHVEGATPEDMSHFAGHIRDAFQALDLKIHEVNDIKVWDEIEPFDFAKLP